MMTRLRPFPKSKIPLPPDFRPLAPLVKKGAPLDIEIGCGVGFHPIRYAKENPGRTLIAFERTSEKFEKFEGRLEHHKEIKNVIAVHGDAIPWIAHCIEKEFVDRYFILYPNPYPKEKQKNLRFHEMPFFSCLVETMKNGGELTLATNEKFYYEAAKEKIVKDWGLKIVEDRLIEKSEKPRTHFEKKYLLRGDQCWNLVFRKPGT